MIVHSRLKMKRNIRHEEDVISRPHHDADALAALIRSAGQNYLAALTRLTVATGMNNAWNAVLYPPTPMPCAPPLRSLAAHAPIPSAMLEEMQCMVNAHLVVRSLTPDPAFLACAERNAALVTATFRHVRDKRALRQMLLPVTVHNLSIAARPIVAATLPIPPDPAAFVQIASGAREMLARAAQHDHGACGVPAAARSAVASPTTIRPRSTVAAAAGTAHAYRRRCKTAGARCCGAGAASRSGGFTAADPA